MIAFQIRLGSAVFCTEIDLRLNQFNFLKWLRLMSGEERNTVCSTNSNLFAPVLAPSTLRSINRSEALLERLPVLQVSMDVIQTSAVDLNIVVTARAVRVVVDATCFFRRSVLHWVALPEEGADWRGLDGLVGLEEAAIVVLHESVSASPAGMVIDTEANWLHLSARYDIVVLLLKRVTVGNTVD